MLILSLSLEIKRSQEIDIKILKFNQVMNIDECLWWIKIFINTIEITKINFISFKYHNVYNFFKYFISVCTSFW